MDDHVYQDALAYHAKKPAGKIQVVSTKPCLTQKDLSLSYTPGVAAPCMEISKNIDEVWTYTNRSNTVAIISDGTSILGLGAIGPEAGIPVMEGKAILFKKFSGIDAYPLCLNLSFSKNQEEYLNNFITAVRSLEPNLAAINLEDIASPLCFELQEKLDASMDIPVFHDDQDGTAVIMISALINALKVVGKNKENVKMVINGAGAAGIACSRLMVLYGFPREHIFLCDSKGLITNERKDVNPQKREFAQNAHQTDLKGILPGADIFIGVSRKDTVTQEMISSMAQDPIVFALANPIPEIMPAEALKAGARVVGTGRSDFPNQVNNSLAFPGIFRGALDTRSKKINIAMKIAAVGAISSILEEKPSKEILEILVQAYPNEATQFQKAKLSSKYILPKQFDLRVMPRVARYVAEAAMKTNVARTAIHDLMNYEKKLQEQIVRTFRGS